MYKRKPRILFYSLTPGLAEQAVAVLLEEGQAWAEAQAGVDSALAAFADMLAWADLMVVLNQQSPDVSAVPSQVTVRHWSVTGNTDEIQAELRRRIQGLLGGIRMLAASDEL